MVAEAFPATPWVLCVRDPVEVCVSLLERRPGWLKDAGEPSHRFADVVDPARSSRTVEEYLARLNAACCRAIGALDPTRGRLVRYETLPGAVWDAVAPWFGLAVDGPLRESMALAARANAKAPFGSEARFAPDAARKQTLASPALRDAVARIARPELELVAARLAGG
jgi:hypothetical protein